MLDSLKDAYYSLEEKWYGFLDKIESRVHVYGVIDKVDQVIPSFILFILIVLLIIIYGALSLFPFLAPLPAGEIDFKALVKNEENEQLSNASVTISYGSIAKTLATDAFG